MAMEYMDITIERGQIPDRVERFLEVADKRLDLFFEKLRGAQIPRFVPSDFIAVYHTLASIAEQNVAPSNNFCEWGSGFGVITCLAAMLGFKAYGIEINQELVQEARQLAKDFDLSTEFACASYIPEGFESYYDSIADSTQLTKRMGLPSEWQWESNFSLGAFEMDIDDFDIIYAYPWPGEALMMEELFDRTAAEKAILVTYSGNDDLNIQQRVLNDSW